MEQAFGKVAKDEMGAALAFFDEALRLQETNDLAGGGHEPSGLDGNFVYSDDLRSGAWDGVSVGLAVFDVEFQG